MGMRKMCGVKGGCGDKKDERSNWEALVFFCMEKKKKSKDTVCVSVEFTSDFRLLTTMMDLICAVFCLVVVFVRGR